MPTWVLPWLADSTVGFIAVVKKVLVRGRKVIFGRKREQRHLVLLNAVSIVVDNRSRPERS